jgi:PleD family two-component response regulator
VKEEVGILILDDDADSQQALHHVLNSEGWRVHVVPLGSQALIHLASGDWNLVVANVTLTDLHGPVFTTLKELAQANLDSDSRGNGASAPTPSGHRQIRVLFLVPPVAARETIPTLEREGLPYSLKPYHLNDFLEKVSDLLLESGAIPEPIRSVNQRFHGMVRRKKPRAGRNRSSAMFASREDYQMSEEEIAEYERMEQEEQRKKKEKEAKDHEFF